MIDRAVISISLVTLLVIIAVAVILLIFPLFQRIEFDMICQNYLMRMDAGGGLTTTQTEQLRADLTAKGYRVDNLSASSSASFGADLTLAVQVSRRDKQIGVDLTMKEVSVLSTYHRTVVCRKIITDAGEP